MLRGKGKLFQYIQREKETDIDGAEGGGGVGGVGGVGQNVNN